MGRRLVFLCAVACNHADAPAPTATAEPVSAPPDAARAEVVADAAPMSPHDCDELWKSARHKASRTVQWVDGKTTCKADGDCALIEVGECVVDCKTAMPVSALDEYRAAAKARFGPECDAWQRAGCAKISPPPAPSCPHLVAVCLREGTGLCVAEQR